MDILKKDDLEDRIRSVDIKGKDWEASGATCIGGRSENQDGFAIDYNKSRSEVVLIVCDGMGGMKGGSIASAYAVGGIYNAAMSSEKGKLTKEAVAGYLHKANEVVYDKATAEPHLRGMGTTAAVLIISPEAAFVAHVGDSRIYQLRKGKKKYRTFDHSKVFEMVSAGIMTEEEARCSSYSNIISRTLGIRPKVEVDMDMIPYKKGDRFVLCSDGIWNSMPESQIIELFNKYDGVKAEVDYMINKVDRLGSEKGGKYDNMTIVVADVLSDSEFQYGLKHNLIFFCKKLWRRIRSLFKKNKKSFRSNRLKNI